MKVFHNVKTVTLAEGECALVFHNGPAATSVSCHDNNATTVDADDIRDTPIVRLTICATMMSNPLCRLIGEEETLLAAWNAAMMANAEGLPN